MTKIKLSAEELSIISALREKGLLNTQEKTSEQQKDNKNANGGKTRKYSVSPFYRVAASGMRQYENVPDARKNTATKRACLDMAVSLSKHYPDAVRFWQDLLHECRALLDSMRFHQECKAWGLQPDYVAQHITVEGKSKVNRVLKEGLHAGYGENAKLFVTPLYNLVIIPETDTEALPSIAVAPVKKEVTGE